MSALSPGSGPCWLAASALLAAQIAANRTEEELALLAAFFTSLADNLALLALEKGDSGSSG